MNASPPLRVLHIINNLGPGGAETLLYRLAISDSASDHVVVSLGPPSWYSSLLEERGVELHHLDMESVGSIPRGLLRLRRIVRESGADVVQCWMYRSNLLGGAVARAAGKPVVWGIHCSSLEPLRPASRLLVYAGGALARVIPDYIVNCSGRSAELHSRLGYSAAPGEVIPNGYDPDQFHADDKRRVETRKELGIADDTFLVGSVARWHPQKDIPNLLRAVRLAHDSGVPIYCLLIGHDLNQQNAELMACIRGTGCDDLAVPLWVRNDVPDLDRAMDLHVLASCGAEAFPNAVAESMLSGTPNAVTDIGDSGYIVGSTGWVVPPRDPQQLAQAIIEAFREWSSSPAEWKRRRMMARQRIVDNFTLDRMAESYTSIWRKVAARRQGRHRERFSRAAEDVRRA